ncbi:hypothetical protein AB0C28_02830 [Nonomuraea sp. NPDC048892]|uniref:hypothetical protein n=1 Tax=Nonomuraea sp. NPDC048892 TaxID=3154624 RepID=UPI003402CE54
MPLSLKFARNLIWLQATIALISVVMLILALAAGFDENLEHLLYAPSYALSLATGLLANRWRTRHPRVRLVTIAVQLAIPLFDLVYFLIEGTLDWIITAPWSALIATLLLLPPARTWFTPAVQEAQPAPPAAV